MRVHAEISYPDRSPSEVFALLADRDFRVAVCEATGAIEHDVAIDAHDDGRVSVTVARTLPAEVPAFVKRFVGETIAIVQSEHWAAPGSDGARTASLVIEIRGQPATMRGSLTLDPSGLGTVEQMSGDLTVAVPFVGGRIEPEIAKAIVEAAATEQRTGRAWLSGSR